MSRPMNEDVLQGEWRQVRGHAKQQWGMLTEDQLGRISGRFEELARPIRQRYGFSKEPARREVDTFLDKSNEKIPARQAR